MKPQEIEKQIVSYIEKIGWKEPTSIQKKSIPVIIRRKHCLLVAPTGSGKTEAAIIPILAYIAQNKQKKKGIRALYITPLKALNRDIFGRLIKYTEDTPKEMNFIKTFTELKRLMSLLVASGMTKIFFQFVSKT